MSMEFQDNATQNNSPDSEHQPSTEDEVPYPDFTQIPAVRLAYVCAYLVVMMLAVLGNAVVCWTVFTNRKMRTAVNYYIVNLAACDLMVGAFVLPVKLLELTSPAGWGLLNDPLCTATMYLQTIFVFASVLTLVAICIERYIAVLHPLESRMQQTKARAKRILLLVWVAPSVVASPFLYPSEAFSNTLRSPLGTISRLTCFVQLPEGVRRGYYTFLFVFIYLLPLLFIGGTCVQVARCLLRDIPVHRQGSIRRQEANRRKVAKMVLMVVLAYAVAWTPYFLVSLVTQYQSVNFMERENFFFTMLNINLFAFLNSCVNPFIYAAMSTRFRNGFLRCLSCICCSAPASERGQELTSGQTDRTKRVRFRCQPTCFLAQSSSDGCASNLASDTSQRTVCTGDGGRRGGSVFRALGGGCFAREHKFIALYAKKDGRVNFNDRQPNGAKSEGNWGNRSNTPADGAPGNIAQRKNSSSTGDVSSLTDGCGPLTENSSSSLRKWSSCLTVSGSSTGGLAF